MFGKAQHIEKTTLKVNANTQKFIFEAKSTFLCDLKANISQILYLFYTISMNY